MTLKLFEHIAFYLNLINSYFVDLESKAIQVDHDYIKPYLKETIKRQRSNDRYARLSSKVRNNTSMAKESDTNTT